MKQLNRAALYLANDGGAQCRLVQHTTGKGREGGMDGWVGAWGWVNRTHPLLYMTLTHNTADHPTRDKPDYVVVTGCKMRVQVCAGVIRFGGLRRAVVAATGGWITSHHIGSYTKPAQSSEWETRGLRHGVDRPRQIKLYKMGNSNLQVSLL